MIKDIFVFKNGNVAVLDENEKQMVKYQKLLGNKNIRWHISR